ncbi:hypothetical protein [Halorubrum laminariae]|uniref:S1 motif domain-containing protein n=1 Tax=Halorubrum laminariae TaxID=1433523 RepID=A0ABD6C4I5_9EURY|nr:hypothetical protein [Halorubrum laminariae]
MPRDRRSQNDFEEGEIYRGCVKRISNSGNGLIAVKGCYLNLGQIDSKYVGDVVRYEYRGGKDAKLIGRPPDNPLEEEWSRSRNNLLNGNM